MANSPIVPTSAVVLSPELLALYEDVHPDTPNQVLISIREWRRNEFIYATLSLTYGVIAFVLVMILTFKLMMAGHDGAARWILGGGVMSVIIGFIQARLRGQQFKAAPIRKPRKSKTAAAEAE